jgi:hypothetical protein
VLAGRPPASTKGHFYWLKIAGGCLARQQKPVLAARTNRFWPNELLLIKKDFKIYVCAHVGSSFVRIFT